MDNLNYYSNEVALDTFLKDCPLPEYAKKLMLERALEKQEKIFLQKVSEENKAAQEIKQKENKK